MRPVIVASQVVPKVALIPLFIIWFGFGITSKIIIVALLSFFPILLNVILGVRSVDSGHRDVMRSLNAGRWQTFRRLEYPSTLPYILAGMEVGILSPWSARWSASTSAATRGPATGSSRV
jgi:NitT/TauT family transport system permease protein